ncbi:bifunctional (p)ppGpp synthetase/guanosine-3',5'-bis(diphosphate) 3'-pyrophosphohydrolase [Dissulfurirhabdus thermomarina]|uniref:Bifunctional (P)ppGpp synthetase/guanosine-3',5'-bis(Diphosphate) 3'-pyrophosphohydrolase n=1 Tax=Dissulfurirhabdus thermomarina TaxID=1765737 RepID=A0A6N9TJM4_DISTH|nr:bifunctional (p)ppGpp synthetase/guanosine-3',5'-bis(diphosphate) 3'-pyrophosphohydrolase [Dissulfurirhabdus thermomarina]NDY41461.1 bifunctional (p)ppGpp synthetase/guanosine-3',5'-bis(diphosphate) 3'-pyrophosphohydrolase [Dissulfurirhabdus thermomarina]NMX24257.1 bifunctional (p)ppGpp synthetase/guanosine-3',5'-bis(diphosphate) 3'-pyrophosphohydrolase [Dissulfurirhabdus thermomarina]
MIRLTDILDRIHSYLPDAETSLVEKAYIFSAKVHHGQVRLSGEPYLSHPLAVAHILAQLRLDMASIAAGLLHDTVEDTLATIEEIRELFGDDVALIVDGVTKISQITFRSQVHRQAENIRKMILAMSKDIRVLLVKLADRLHNMRTLEYQRANKRERIARETLEIYAPLASRLGIDWIKRELEDLGFAYQFPEEYENLKKAVETRLGQRRAYVEEVKELIARKMAEFGLSCRVLGRPKHLYSIYRKMRNRNLPLDEIYDLIAFRIILKTTQECYEALGIVHSLWKPVPGRFKDYISLPKANMYQSLHTTVIGPDGERMEIQIRTEEMDRVAREGIAAHWLYKEGKILSPEKARQFDWLNQLMEWQKDLEDPREFLESVRMDLFPNEVYVFTPRGEVKEFPQGATPIDFAYAIHTEVGHHCAGAKVNGRMVPLKYQLQNGDVVEIITSPHHTPSRDWLSLAKTSRALARIRHWIKTEEREKSLALGRDLCLREFRKHRLDFNDLLKDRAKAAEVARALSFRTLDDLLVAVGYGKVSPVQVIRKVLPAGAAGKAEGPAAPAEAPTEGAPPKGREGIVIEGVDNLLVHLARCCTPVPGDEVVGYITRGRGVTVHRESCRNVRSLEPGRRVEVTWAGGDEATYPARLKVIAEDKKGMLAAVSNAISAAEANILEARVQTTPDHRAVFNFFVEVDDAAHLKRVLSGVRRVQGVIRVDRLR